MARKYQETPAVKIDPLLLEKVEKMINKEEHRYRFANRKQFVDLAVFEYLKKIEREEDR